jgi:hypothetical protein
MMESLERLFALAEKVRMSPQQVEEQRRSFAYGSAKIENDRVTREMVDQAAEDLRAAEKANDGTSQPG